MKETLTGNEAYYTSAECLEKVLGNPMDLGSPFSFKQSLELDERELFPSDFCALLEEWGLQDYYVPIQYGGKLRRLDEAFTLVRTVARRDLSTAIAHSKTFLGSAPIWIAGTAAQQMSLARRILNHEYVALALTEEAHGGDLGASECMARKIRDCYLLFGSKWLVNNATRSTALCLLARTSTRKGPFGVSLFYVEKEKLDRSSFRYEPKIKTHGIRGIDISGIHFESAVVAEDALIGKEQHGLEPVLKTFQITRPLCSALSLGGADTALRLSVDFARQRRIYGTTVFALPAAREVLIEAFISILLCDCAALFAARALHAAPEQMSLWSSVTKYMVPTTLENMVRDVATILGARYYLREHYAYGAFQKIVRDIAIVSLFDGSTRLNLSLIASQLGSLRHHEASSEPTVLSEAMARLQQICSFSQPLPEFDPGRLLLTNRGRDDLRTGLAFAAEQIEVRLDGEMPQPLIADLKLLLTRFAQEQKVLNQAVASLIDEQKEIHVTVKGFELARIHCILHAASACYHMWLFNRSVLHKAFASGEWLILCLLQLFKLLYPREELVSTAMYSEHLTAILLQMMDEERLFSIVPHQLAPLDPYSNKASGQQHIAPTKIQREA